MTRSGLTFIFNHVEVDGQLPIPLIHDHVFRKGTEQEVEAIQKHLHSYALNDKAWDCYSPYQTVVRVEKDERSPGTTRFFHDLLPYENWKYWVIAHECSNACIHELQIAAILLPIDLDFAFTLLYEQPHQKGHVHASTGMPFHLVEIYSNPGFDLSPPMKVRAEDIGRIKDYYDRMRDLSNEASFVGDALRNFYSIRAMPGASTLRAVGYFAIIEALVTHTPRLAESLDSITHQIVNKLLLLSKRFERSLPFAAYFSNAPEEKLWKMLYGYRSCLAHGGRADFKKEHALLKSDFAVVNFLKETVKLLILFGLKDHELLADLKKC